MVNQMRGVGTAPGGTGSESREIQKVVRILFVFFRYKRSLKAVAATKLVLAIVLVFFRSLRALSSNKQMQWTSLTNPQQINENLSWL